MLDVADELAEREIRYAIAQALAAAAAPSSWWDEREAEVKAVSRQRIEPAVGDLLGEAAVQLVLLDVRGRRGTRC